MASFAQSMRADGSAAGEEAAGEGGGAALGGEGGKVRPLYRSVDPTTIEIPGVCFVGRLLGGALFGAMFAIVCGAVGGPRSVWWGIGMVVGVTLGVYAATNAASDSIRPAAFLGNLFGATAVTILCGALLPPVEAESLWVATAAAGAAIAAGNTFENKWAAAFAGVVAEVEGRRRQHATTSAV